MFKLYYLYVSLCLCICEREREVVVGGGTLLFKTQIDCSLFHLPRKVT